MVEGCIIDLFNYLTKQLLAFLARKYSTMKDMKIMKNEE